VSSRTKGKDGAQRQQQRVEDFMDEEDLREAEESRLLQTTEDFAGFGTVPDPSRRDTLIDIFRPSGESMGTRLLKRMGWKEGQGIGPRVQRSADLGEGQYTGKLHSFAPSDTPVVELGQKHDTKGLGFQGPGISVKDKFKPSSSAQHRDNVDKDDSLVGPAATARFESLTRTKPKSRKGGFGVGVLNDTGSDDEDPYSMGPKISYNKTIGGEKATKKVSRANPLVRSKPVLLSKEVSRIRNLSRRCHDGRLPLDGFVLGDDLDGIKSLSLREEKYKPPPVPDGWVSAFSSDVSPSAAQQPGLVNKAVLRPDHTSKSRGQALGETPLPGKSVFDFMSASARDRLASATGRTDFPPALGEVPSGSASTQTTRSLQDLVPKLEQDVALQALSRSTGEARGWMPYAEDLDKRERYRAFLEIRAGLRSSSQGDELPQRAPGMKQDDWVHELQEFARAAEVFRPVSGLMASRFTSSTLGASQKDTSSDEGELLRQKRSKPEDPAEAAARMGMYGPMTRSTINFYPTRLLCKRFGVPMPEIRTRSPGPSDLPSAQSASESFYSAGYHHQDNSIVKQQPSPPDISAQVEIMAPNSAPQSNEGPVDLDRNETLEQEKPGMALFKAVFGSDDEDDDDED
jgi:G patch domain-containing protein 1